MPRSLIFVCGCIAVFLTLLNPLHAQNGTGIFMGKDTVLRTGKTLQLSLNANISQFLYQPTGDHIAYVSIKGTGSTQTAAVKYVTTRHSDPETVTLESITGDTPGATSPAGGTIYTASLMNWSQNGRYLAFEVDAFPNAQNDDNYTTGYYLADTGAQAFSVQIQRLPRYSVPRGFIGLTKFAWSPSGDQIAILQSGSVPVDPLTSTDTEFGAVYTPAADGAMHVLKFPSGDNVLGWQDDTHLLITDQIVYLPTNAYYSYDLSTDVLTPIPHNAIWPPVAQNKVHYGASILTTTPKAPGLTLESDQQSVLDPHGVAAAPIWTVWLRRPSAPKPLSALAVAVVHQMASSPILDPNDDDVSNPRPQWSPNGNALAYLANGDLFVTPLIETPATSYEKVALGEKIPCHEETTAIASNLKLIGLGLLQYAQDNGERYPAAGGWQDSIMPYVKDSSLFNFAGITVNYSPPQNLSIDSLDDPSSFPIATADTPCAQTILYADGHVQSIQRHDQQQR